MFKSTIKSINNSQKIFNQKLTLKLNEIFDAFDSEKTGRISADKIDLDAVPVEILTIFKPLLVEMENFNEDLDKEEFVDSAISLLEKLDINSRNTILNFGKHLPKSLKSLEKELFKPKISKKSEELAQNQKSHFFLKKMPLEDRL